MRIGFLLTLAMFISVLMGACASTEPVSTDPDAGSGDRNEVVATVLARVEADLGRPAKLDVKTFNIADGWALIDGNLQDADGQPIASKRYDGLLKKTGPKWTILEHAIGPTEVPWANWKASHPDAPAQLWP